MAAEFCDHGIDRRGCSTCLRADLEAVTAERDDLEQAAAALQTAIEVRDNPMMIEVLLKHGYASGDGDAEHVDDALGHAGRRIKDLERLCALSADYLDRAWSEEAMAYDDTQAVNFIHGHLRAATTGPVLVSAEPEKGAL